jgi:hypothetical protein
MTEKEAIADFERMIRSFNTLKTRNIISISESNTIEIRLHRFIEKSGYIAVAIGTNEYKVNKR